MIVTDEIKKSIKQWLILAAVLVAIGTVGTMDFNDEVAQHEVNMNSATYVNDKLNNEGE